MFGYGKNPFPKLSNISNGIQVGSNLEIYNWWNVYEGFTLLIVDY